MAHEPKYKACETLCGPLLALRTEINELEAKLEERKQVEKAKWILVKTKGVDEETAHKLLIVRSRAARKKLVEIAELVIAGNRLLNCANQDAAY